MKKRAACIIVFLLGAGLCRAQASGTGARSAKEEARPAQPPEGRGYDAAFFERLVPLNRVKSLPGPFDWMAVHPEPGQTFSDFVAAEPDRPDQVRKHIYIVLLGEVDPRRKDIIEQTARFIEVYYGLPVRFLPDIPLSAVDSKARRVHPQTGDRQILSTYIIDSLLLPLKPEDAFALIAFTAADLWPGEGWNFVFGQASLADRVGVWSIYRNGDPNENEEMARLCLLRTLKTGTHELGHMFSLHHCIYYECNLNGSNSRVESDRAPLWLCPVCLRKLVWSVDLDPVLRYKKLREMCARMGLRDEADFYGRAAAVLAAP